MGVPKMKVVEGAQGVLSFADAKATAEEIRGWQRDLADAQVELAEAKEALKRSTAGRKVEGAKERVKELQQRIDSAQAGLVDGLAAS